MFDDVIISIDQLSCLTDEEKNILLKEKNGSDGNLYFQTKDLDNLLYQFEIIDGKILQHKNKMSEFRSDINNYDVLIYTYFNLGDKVVDCELSLHIKEGIIQEITKKKFSIEEPPCFKWPEYEYKFGYYSLMFFSDVFFGASQFFRTLANKRRIMLLDEE